LLGTSKGEDKSTPESTTMKQLTDASKQTHTPCQSLQSILIFSSTALLQEILRFFFPEDPDHYLALNFGKKYSALSARRK